MPPNKASPVKQSSKEGSVHKNPGHSPGITPTSAPIVTIDGPAASGKTSISRELARRLGWSWVSTGSFYRGLSYVANQMSIDLNDEDRLAEVALTGPWRVEMNADDTVVIFDGVNVTDEIRKEKVGSIASKISQLPKVRTSLLAAQRKCQHGVKGLVAEGRDCGSVVFPEAAVKIYLSADSENRAERRAKERGASVEIVHKQQEIRDQQDTQRQVAPLQVPEGAVVVDNNARGFDEVVEEIEKIVRKNLGLR